MRPYPMKKTRASRRIIGARRRQAADSPGAAWVFPNRKSALDVSPEERDATYEAAWNRLGFGFALAYYDLLLSKPANDTAAEFVRRKIADAVHDPVVREKLTPRDFPIGARRPSVDSGYFQAFNLANVELADIRTSPIVEFIAGGIRTTAKTHELDMVIFATGFDAFTGSLLKPDIIGRNGVSLREKWSAGPVTQLGIAVAGFPNLFIVVGPGSPSLLSNVLVSTEEQLDWLERLVMYMSAHGLAQFEATQAAERAWVAAACRMMVPGNVLLFDAVVLQRQRDSRQTTGLDALSGGVRGYREIAQSDARRKATRDSALAHAAHPRPQPRPPRSRTYEPL